MLRLKRKQFFSPLAFFIYGVVLLVTWLIIVMNGLHNLFGNSTLLCTQGSGAHGDFPNCPPVDTSTATSNVSWWVATVTGWSGIVLIILSLVWWVNQVTAKRKRRG